MTKIFKYILILFLFNSYTSETKNLIEKYPHLEVSLPALMQKHINDGRSTTGVAQKNTDYISILKSKGISN